MNRPRTKDLTLQLPRDEDEQLPWEPIALPDDKSEEDTALVHAFLCGDDEVLA